MTWQHEGNYYQFWNDGTDDGKFTVTNVRPGTYTLHAFADGVLGEFAKTDITVEAGKDLDLGKLDWQPVRYGKQIWEIGYPNRNGSEFFKGDQYWFWGWNLRYALLFPNDITYTVGKSDWHKDWFFEEVPHATNLSFVNPAAKDPKNQPFGWVAQPRRPARTCGAPGPGPRDHLDHQVQHGPGRARHGDPARVAGRFRQHQPGHWRQRQGRGHDPADLDQRPAVQHRPGRVA